MSVEVQKVGKHFRKMLAVVLRYLKLKSQKSVEERLEHLLMLIHF